jgi:hypothetical protein
MTSSFKIRICLRVENGFFNCVNSIISKNLMLSLKKYSDDSVEPVITEFPHYNYSIFNESLNMFNVLFECCINLNKDKFLRSKSKCIPMFAKYTYSSDRISSRIMNIVTEFINKNIDKSEFKFKIDFISVDIL